MKKTIPLALTIGLMGLPFRPGCGAEEGRPLSQVQAIQASEIMACCGGGW